VLAGGISWISVNLPRYAVNGIMGIEAAGLFSVGFGLGQRASMVAAMAVTVAALPLAVKRNTEGGREAALDQLAQNIALLMAIMAPALVGLWLVSPSLVHLAIGQPYWEATLSLLPWSMLSGAVGAFASNYLNHVFLLDRQTWRLFGIEVATTAATAILAFWLTHTHGLVGAVWAILGPRAAMTAILTIWLVWRGRLVVPVNHFAITAVATATMAGAVLAVPAHDTIVSLVAKIAIGALAYISCLAFFYRDWVGEKLRRAA
jgi:O-antigen/teichoic acid export membrane protein